MNNLAAYLAWTRKAIINVLGLLGTVLTLNLLPDPYDKWVSAAIAILTAVSHFITPNAEKPGTGEAVEDFDEEEEEVPAEWLPSESVTASHVAAKHEQAAPPSE